MSEYKGWVWGAGKKSSTHGTKTSGIHTWVKSRNLGLEMAMDEGKVMIKAIKLKNGVDLDNGDSMEIFKGTERELLDIIRLANTQAKVDTDHLSAVDREPNKELI